MSQQFRLIDSNQELGLKNGFYQNLTDRYRDSLLPEKMQLAIASIFLKAKDKSLFSNDFKSSTLDLDLNNLLSEKQYQFLQSFNYDGINTVLDISEDTGGVAHYIADKVGQIESIKVDPALAELAVNRCSNNPNVIHISEDLDKLQFPDQHYDLIILGQLESLNLSHKQFKQLCTKLQKSLSEKGVLVCNVINSDRINKWFNPEPESSDSDTAFSDLYVHSNDEVLSQLSRKEIRDLLLNSNFSNINIHANFSTKKNCQVLFSEDYLSTTVNASNHFYQLGFIDNPDINSFLLAQGLVSSKQDLVDFASRYVVVIANSRDATKSFYDNDFSYFGNESLNAEYQTITTRLRSAQTVHKTPSHIEKPNKSNHELVSLNLKETQFYKGPLLAGEWLNAIVKQDTKKFESLILEYCDYLKELSKLDDFNSNAYNAIPSNIVINARGKRGFNMLNTQWQINTDLSVNFVLFKALMDFAQSNLTQIKTYALEHDLATVGVFILQNMPTVFELEELNDFLALEQEIQTVLNESFSSTTLEEFIKSPLININDLNQQDSQKAPTSNKTTAERQNQIIAGQVQRLTQYRENNEHLNQRIGDITEHRRNLVDKLKKQSSDAEQTQLRMQAEIDNLHERLHAQHVRNDELHGYLLMRPTTRAKRVARRTLNRFTGQNSEEPLDPATEIIEGELEESTVEAELPKGFLIGQNTEDYDLWISENTLSKKEIEGCKKDIETMAFKPVFSILVPIYNTDPEYLLPMIESVRKQIYPHWQLCLVDDCSPKSYLKRILEHEALQDERISIQLNDVNQGISVTTNDALAMAKGDYIALLDHDDEISIDALYENAKVINQHPDVGLIYSDEDKMEMDGTRSEPYFKPDFSPDLLHTNNYICHFTVIKKSIADSIGGFREGLDGSQDHDIIIRAAAATERVIHIPKILYHWRKIPGSTAVQYDSKSYAWEAGRKAVEDQLKKQEDGINVEFGSLKGTYRVHRKIHGNPLVSIIIPFKDKPELLDSCINSILNRSSYQNIEIIGVSNNSEEELTFERIKYFSGLDSRITFVEKNIPFNFSAICNFGVDQAKGEYVLLLNNDIEIISPDWIEQMLQNAQRPEIGAVGGKLLYPDGRIQHAGVVAGMVGAAGHPHKFFPDNHIGYHGRLHMAYNVSAITGAMMMMKTSKFKEVGGFDEENLAVAYNDIDLCLKLISKGYYNLFTPHAKATHHESISRGYEDTDEKMQRLLKEQQHFLDTWDEFLKIGDPFYNPNLSLKNERFSMKFKD